MDSLEDLMQQKAQALDVEGKRSELELIQGEIERYFEKGVRAKKIVNEDELIVVVSNPPLASDVRYRQMALLDAIRSVAPKVQRLRVSLF